MNLTIPKFKLSNCSAERAFPKINRVKNNYRLQINLKPRKIILTAESDILQTINNEIIIKGFCQT